MELPADPDLDGRREHKLEPGVLEDARHPRQDVGHAAEEHRRRQDGADDELQLLPALLGLARGALAVDRLARRAFRARLGQVIAGGGDRLAEAREVRPRGIEDDRRLLRREVHRRGLHARHGGERALDLADARGAVHPADGRGHPLHHFPLKRAKTSSSSSIFCCRSPLEPERIASATHDSMWRPSRSFSTCSRAPCTAAICIRMSTQYASLSTIRWSPCTCPSIRRIRPRILAFVSWLITPSYPRGVVSRRGTAESNRRGPTAAGPGFGVRTWGRRSYVEERWLLRRRDGLAIAGLGDVLLPLLRLCGGAGCALRELPALLVGDAVTLLDHEEI